MNGIINKRSYQRPTCPRCGSDKVRWIYIADYIKQEAHLRRLLCDNPNCRALSGWSKWCSDRAAMRRDFMTLCKMLTGERVAGTECAEWLKSVKEKGKE